MSEEGTVQKQGGIQHRVTFCWGGSSRGSFFLPVTSLPSSDFLSRGVCLFPVFICLYTPWPKCFKVAGWGCRSQGPRLNARMQLDQCLHRRMNLDAPPWRNERQEASDLRSYGIHLKKKQRRSGSGKQWRREENKWQNYMLTWQRFVEVQRREVLL
jgi:hypothetical protein